jgi:hypothetical protein
VSFQSPLDLCDLCVLLNRFLEVGVRHFIDLTEPGELVPYDAILSEEALRTNITVTHERFPIPDLSVPRAAADLGEILLTLDRRIREGGTVFLHCWDGVGRTGLVVGCWLQEHSRTPDDALAELRQKWSTVEKIFRQPESPETTEQVNWVRTWPQRAKRIRSGDPLADRFTRPCDSPGCLVRSPKEASDFCLPIRP